MAYPHRARKRRKDNVKVPPAPPSFLSLHKEWESHWLKWISKRQFGLFFILLSSPSVTPPWWGPHSLLGVSSYFGLGGTCKRRSPLRGSIAVVVLKVARVGFIELRNRVFWLSYQRANLFGLRSLSLRGCMSTTVLKHLIVRLGEMLTCFEDLGSRINAKYKSIWNEKILAYGVFQTTVWSDEILVAHAYPLS